MKNTGIQLNTNYDVAVAVRRDAAGKILAGMTVGDVTYQNQAMLLQAHKGEFKEHPMVGVGINDICNDHDFALWRREISTQIEGDGQQISKLSLKENGLILEANY
jgi:hypothetical protein